MILHLDILSPCQVLILYKFGYVKNLCCIRCGYVQVMLESNFYTLDLLYNVGVHVPAPRAARCCDIMGRNACNHIFRVGELAESR
jgi:hypothetical protein